MVRARMRRISLYARLLPQSGVIREFKIVSMLTFCQGSFVDQRGMAATRLCGRLRTQDLRGIVRDETHSRAESSLPVGRAPTDGLLHMSGRVEVSKRGICRAIP